MKYAHGVLLCCGYTLTDFPISIRLASLALWQSNDCPSASKATLMNMDKYFMWIHYERLHNHNKAKHNKTGCIFLGIYCNNDQFMAEPNIRLLLNNGTCCILAYSALNVVKKRTDRPRSMHTDGLWINVLMSKVGWNLITISNVKITQQRLLSRSRYSPNCIYLVHRSRKQHQTM